MEEKGISQAVISRLPRYFRYLGELRDRGVERISSQDLSTLMKVTASQIPWDLDDDESDMLPVMQSDIMLSDKKKTLIIDAKYYTHTMQMQYDVRSIHSNNLYQIFTYVKNKAAKDDNKELLIHLSTKQY